MPIRAAVRGAWPLLAVLLVTAVFHVHSVAAQLSNTHAVVKNWDVDSAQWIITAAPDASTVPKSRLPKRVAIIGAGPGGSSFAYQYSHLADLPADAQIDLFEAKNRVGGRVASEELVVPVLGDRTNVSLGTHDWGASIFVKENRNLVQWAAKFNLSSSKQGSSEADLGDLLVWNGTTISFAFDPSSVDGKTRAAWRYTTSPMATSREANAAAAALGKIYDDDHPAYTSIGDLARQLNLSPYLTVTAESYLRTGSRWYFVNDAFRREMVDGVTRANYGHSIDEVHALAALVGFVDGPVYSIDSGNQRIFEALIKNSKANVHLGTRITHIDFDETTSTYSLTTSTGAHKTGYDAVVLALPLDVYSSLHLPEGVHITAQPREYHHIHVTMVVGALHPDRGFTSTTANVFTLRTTPHIASIGRLHDLSSVAPGLGLFKVFSTVPLDDPTPSSQEITNLGYLFNRVDHIWRRQWYAYPIMVPTAPGAKDEEVYPEIVLHDAAPAHTVAGGLFYLNGMERLLSTMETQTIAATNLVRLLKQRAAYAAVAAAAGGSASVWKAAEAA
ncbi:hypothetical protein AMAG_10869 [Allomyces macrogynus ATCC 38327]|uniref:Prenylcysteine lyase domain-containing protein n=1 Tax=Allomyces macrogynus (strain ATCC 38327) TaxID=578462 RepID=A0A0L0SRW2_ALLM3|nr:hypothetical protein AMAG_10869 [Allomyces macrogynus ATCC 38327]|eukprot:KNE65221.1 hypothetical protein AMAG_10869 [Allomyces macrogynus ATCC 38327]